LLYWLDEQAGERFDFRIYRATALAMLGRSQEACAIIEAERAKLREQGNMTYLATAGQVMSFVAMRAGKLELAERLLSDACSFLETHGERGLHSILAARLSVLVADRGRLDEAEAWAARALQLGALDDVLTQTIVRRGRAKVLARGGDGAAAERLAREAVELILATDNLEEQADTYADLADVLSYAAKTTQAARALDTAATLYRKKGDIVGQKVVLLRRAALDNNDAASLSHGKGKRDGAD
jgi:tetratricopeptide (TPR) repeat protein